MEESKYGFMYLTDEQAEEMVKETPLTMEDLLWFDQWQPEVFRILEHYVVNPYPYYIQVFGTWDAWLDYCSFYDIEDELNPPDAWVFIDAGLSGVVYISWA